MGARAGVTLVELLLVLVILGIVTTLVVPGTASVWRSGASPDADGPPGLAAARRLAVARGVTVRLTTTADGEWRVTIPGTADPLASGRDDKAGGVPTDLFTDLLIDPLGTCRPGAQSATRAPDAAFDAGRCRWLPLAPSPTGADTR
jgi:prepilin-type N-terminal cleavage/methylation domain-containing protein